MKRYLGNHHLGVRAEGMILAAAVWILLGVGAWSSPSIVDPTPSVWHQLLPVWANVGMWLAAGILALITAPFERASVAGIAALVVPPALRFTSYIGAWIVEIVPGPPPGDPRGWVSSLFYALMVMFVILLSHIPANVRSPLLGRRL